MPRRRKGGARARARNGIMISLLLPRLQRHGCRQNRWRDKQMHRLRCQRLSKFPGQRPIRSAAAVARATTSPLTAKAVRRIKGCGRGCRSRRLPHVANKAAGYGAPRSR